MLYFGLLPNESTLRIHKPPLIWPCTLFLVLLLNFLSIAAPQNSPTKLAVAPEIATQHLIKRIDPAYPPLARSAQVDGKVRLGITITQSGSVIDLVYLSGHPLLVKAAYDAVAQWKYKPFVEDGRAIAVKTTVEAAFSLGTPHSQTLRRELQQANVSTDRFDAVELNEGITSFAINNGDPFLLAYYTDDGSGLLKPPLHVIRYERASHTLERADLGDVRALLQQNTPMDCLGSALSIREYHSVIYIDTHLTPSAGCLILLNSNLHYKTALSGSLVGLMGGDYAIIQASEIHFMSVHPLHVQVFDLKRNRLVPVYPFNKEPFRNRYSRLIKAHISDRWCEEFNAQCDPQNFDVNIEGEVAVNEVEKVFGFEARFDASGFGEQAESRVPPTHVAYVFREHDGTWEHRAFDTTELNPVFHVPNVETLVQKQAEAVFERGPR